MLYAFICHCCDSVDQDQVEADVPNHKLWVTSNKSAGQLDEALSETGKKVLYVGPASNSPLSNCGRLRVGDQYTIQAYLYTTELQHKGYHLT